MYVIFDPVHTLSNVRTAEVDSESSLVLCIAASISLFSARRKPCVNRFHKEHNIHDRTLCIPVCTMIPPAVWMLLWLFVESGQTYTIPEPSVVVQSPRGFQVSIPGNLFVFNLK